MKTQSSHGKYPSPALDQAEWDFSECPDDELTRCYWYEYARESISFCTQFEAAREAQTSQGSSGGGVEFPDGSRLRLDCPEFPQTPWLKIPKMLRETPFIPLRFVEPVVTSAYVRQPVGFNPSTGEEVVKLEICWASSKTQIEADFKLWIEKWIEIRQNAISDPELVQRMKAIKPMKIVKGRLKALGALRLLRLMTVKEAEHLTARLSPLGKPLYELPAGWSHAKAEAEKVLLSFDPNEKIAD